MKFSPDTLEILKNFSDINQSLYFQEGNVLSTISPQENLAAFATITETIPADFGIYNLKEFLNIYGLYSNPAIDFREKFIIITENNGKNKVRIYSAGPDLITFPELSRQKSFNKTLKDDHALVSFTLSSDDLVKIIKAAGIINATYLSLESDGDNVNLVLSNPKNTEATQYSLEVSDGNGDEFKLFLKTDNLRLYKGAYEVEFSPKGLTAFRNTSLDLNYFIAQEEISVYKSCGN